VQNYRAKQSPRTIRRAIKPRTQTFAVAYRTSQNRFRKSGKPKIALLDYRAKVTTSRIKVPNGVRWKNLLRRRLRACRLPESDP